jgi:hypothetical protein
MDAANGLGFVAAAAIGTAGQPIAVACKQWFRPLLKQLESPVRNVAHINLRSVVQSDQRN